MSEAGEDCPSLNDSNCIEEKETNESICEEDAHASDLNNSFMEDSDANKENEGDEKVNKRRSDEGLEIRDELDFEEEKESGEEGEESGGEKEKPKKVVNREEGELTDEDEDESLLRQEPKTVCRFFNKGQCTWGTNCRFLHPGVSDKGNYNMFAAPKAQNQSEKEEKTEDKERAREVRRFIPEPLGFESAWERGLRHAKEMMKRANKRKETDADFEEKRFNLSLGQAELDRENDYYTRPASPVYKPSDEVIECLDPYEKQAIRHFRGGHFENFEVRYKVDPAYPNRGPEHVRSRRDKFEREVTERIPRRMRPASPAVEDPKVIKEKRYPRPRTWKEERVPEATPTVAGKGEAEVWADPWARRKTPVKRTKKVTRTRSYSSGSSSRSSRSSRSSSYSSYSRSGSRSSSRSHSSRSTSRSITPPIHPRQQRATMRGGGRGARGRGADRGGMRGMGFQRNPYQNQQQQFSQPPNPPPNHPLAPDVASYPRQPAMPGGGVAVRRDKPREFKDSRLQNARQQQAPRTIQPVPKERPPIQPKQEPIRKYPQEIREGMPIQPKIEPTGRKPPQDARERILNSSKPDPRSVQADQNQRLNIIRKQEQKQAIVNSRERVPPVPRTTVDQRLKAAESSRERVDMFGRTIRKEIPKSPTLKPPPRPPGRTRGRRKFSLSRSRSASHSRSGSFSGSSRSRSRSHSASRSGSRSRSRGSSSATSVTPPPSPVNKRKVAVEKVRKPGPATVAYGESAKTKAIDIVKVAGQKQQIKLTLKKTGLVKQVDKPVLDVDDDSGESDTDARILKKRKMDTVAANPPPSKKPRAPSPTVLAAMTTAGSGTAKKPSAARREELLKQLRAVEDAIARKRSKPL